MRSWWDGRQGHVAYPHLADNPIPRLMTALAALKAEPLDRGTAHFDPSNLEIVTVDTGNPSANVIPAEARGAVQHPLQRCLVAPNAAGGTPPPAGRRAGGRASLDLRTLQRPGVPDRAGAIRDALRGRRRSRNRPSSWPFDDGRDLGCPLHHAGLPGPRVRARRRHDACRRRARRDRRSRQASSHLRRVHRPIFRPTTLIDSPACLSSIVRFCASNRPSSKSRRLSTHPRWTRRRPTSALHGRPGWNSIKLQDQNRLPTAERQRSQRASS